MAKVLLSALVGMVLLVLTGGYVLRPDHTRRNYDLLPDMANSPAYASLSENPNFSDGMTQRPPVPGTIARGLTPIHYQATPEDAKRAGEELSSPFAGDDTKVLARGAVVYANFCQACHGRAGVGDGPVTQRGFPPPPSLLADHARTIKDGQMFHILTFGQNNMPSYASQVMRDDRWRAILYVRQMQKQSPPTTAPVP